MKDIFPIVTGGYGIGGGGFPGLTPGGDDRVIGQFNTTIKGSKT